ncbi:2TM domain-containing protein [Candidatus Dojkabacteria bacterium]|uniref:2TM domain-containing protein n=1 Tax=Candidatus Dojkabacteria bacterium TaxID=2099670 RepID=A0A955RJI6_9BACT|nr:2TM domain-containing protein [Candidatus Dojkabacteria bacterium]
MNKEQRELYRTEKLRELLKHFLIFLLVIFAVFFINPIFYPQIPIFTVVILTWGVAMLAHAIYVFSFFGFLGQEMEEKMFAKAAQAPIVEETKNNTERE